MPTESTCKCTHEPIDPATTRLRGSITYNHENGYDIEWESIDEFHRWLENKQQAHSIEICIGKTAPSKGSTLYMDYQIWVCSRHGTGGEKAFHKQTDQKAKMESKCLPSGCPCQVKIKIYPHMATVLGRYSLEHSHPTGKDNLKHVWIRVPTREQIERLIRFGLMDREIVRNRLCYQLNFI